MFKSLLWTASRGSLVLGLTNPILAKENKSLETLVDLKELDKGKVQLTYYGKAPEKLYVHIYNEENKEVFKETIKSRNGIQKPYNISEFPHGLYRFEVRVADEIVVQNVSHRAPMNSDMVKLTAVSLGKSNLRIMVLGPEFKEFKLSI